MNKDETLIFVHIPKTAGTTFSTILRRAYPEGRHSMNRTAQVAQFQQMPEAERAQIKFLEGHFAYGLHTSVPRPCRYITFLRDPIERVISTYYYIARRPSHHLHKTVVEDNVSLGEFVSGSYLGDVHNFQTKLIAGVRQFGTPDFHTEDESLLAVAKARLDSDFTAFGLTERFDESLIVICHALGWSWLKRNFFYRRINVTENRKSKTEIPAESIDIIVKKNEMDIELYRYASELFKQRIEAVPSFHLSLAAYRSLNALAQQYQSLRHSSMWRYSAKQDALLNEKRN